jgi:hypothetical protein
VGHNQGSKTIREVVICPSQLLHRVPRVGVKTSRYPTTSGAEIATSRSTKTEGRNPPPKECPPPLQQTRRNLKQLSSYFPSLLHLFDEPDLAHSGIVSYAAGKQQACANLPACAGLQHLAQPWLPGLPGSHVTLLSVPALPEGILPDRSQSSAGSSCWPISSPLPLTKLVCRTLLLEAVTLPLCTAAPSPQH